MQLGGGVGLAHPGLGGLQAVLAGTLRCHFTTEADDGGGLAGAAGLQGGEAFLGQGGAALLGLAALVVAPEQQGEGAEECGAVYGLAEGGHAAAFPQPQSACRW